MQCREQAGNRIKRGYVVLLAVQRPHTARDFLSILYRPLHSFQSYYVDL